ncbi:MAG TPA: GNAT family N-acetyltransferase [Acidimicrobiales bacterium]|nr:GNAT family N-acetyltransferase [Acidimicrobiales bacterium]
MMVRAAELSDAAGIGLVHVRSWQAAYRDLVPQSFLDGLDAEQRGAGWARYLGASPHEREAVLVAELDGQVVGFASVGPSRDGDADGVGEVRAIYLLADRWGQGMGRELMRAALDALRALGFTQASLWVLGSNQRARRFYEAGGWCPDGASKSDDSRGFLLTEVRYTRAIS